MAMRKATHEEYQLVIDCLSFLETNSEDLNNFETDFLTGKGDRGQYDNWQEKIDKYAEEIKVSDGQMGVFRRMYDKIVNGEDLFRGR